VSVGGREAVELRDERFGGCDVEYGW